MLILRYHQNECQSFIEEYMMYMTAWFTHVVTTPSYKKLHRLGCLQIYSAEWEDAGNKAYLLVMRLLAPKWLTDNYPPSVTPEKVGNLVESLLGYLIVHPLAPNHPGTGFRSSIYPICSMRLEYTPT